MATILAVDDSTSMRQMVAATLAEAGHDVISACDGQEALDTACQRQFDLVLTDVNMPEMDGITFIRQLRERQSYRFVPMLVLTTEGSREKKAEGKAAGATGWLVKPFDPNKLLTTIRKVLD